jgi:2-oxoisovalerate dehydrogenase E2 component (dihydrolipoyl transacylase)
MTPIAIVMPQLGESVSEGTIARWLVKPGDRLVEFAPMLEVDTDKVSAEVPAPFGGVLKQILAQEGDTVVVGAEIALAESDQTAEEGAPARTAPAAVRDLRHVARDGHISAAVSIVARDHSIDLTKVAGSGLGGRVTRRDVQRIIEGKEAGSSASSTPSKRPDTDHAVPLSRVRRLIAENMALSNATIPHAWQTQEVDMSGVVASRRAHIEQFKDTEGYSLTHLPYVIKATASALRDHSDANATFNQSEIIVHDSINIGVSVGLEDTLVVPVVRDADQLTVGGIARAVADLAKRAREKTLKADDLRGGTFTVNNSGTFGTLLSYSVIVPGQAGILTMEAIVERPVAIKGMVEVKPMMYLCFSLDHRVLDGLAAARFLTSCRQWLEAVTVDTPIW